MTTAEVSIVVPVFGRWRVTEACLSALLSSANNSPVSAEIIVADDASTDETATAISQFSGGRWPVRHVRNDDNLGFLRNCNAAAKHATGEFLCLLNNDVIVEPGWLERLLAVFREESAVGAVGPVFLDRRGRILECGGMVHRDGTARQLGHGHPPSDRRYRYRNDVDYVSAACLLVKRTTFEELGGFDERYAPAYYEDTDLCMRLAESGLRIMVEPAAQVVHDEGSTHGVAGGIKRYQDINRRKFHARWSERLAAHHPPPDAPEDRVRTWRRGRTTAFYYPRPLTFDQDSGALRIYRLMRELRRRGEHVLLVSPDDDGPRIDELSAAGIESMRAAWGGDERHLARLLADPPAVAVFSHTLTEQRFGPGYHHVSPDTIRCFDTVDLEFLREARRRALELGVTAEPVLGPDNLHDDGLVELTSAKRSDMTFVVSSYERALLIERFFMAPERVRVVSNIHPLEPDPPAFGERNEFVFLAGFAHPPNADALTWTVEEVWPLVRRQASNAQLHVYGSQMPRSIKALHSPATGVHVHGYVADHRAALGRARVMLAPLRYGAGVKGKIGEALAVGTPVVTTPVGAEGMDGDGEALLVADTASGLAEHALRVAADEAEWNRRSKAGWALLEARFSARANVDELQAAAADAERVRREPSLALLDSRLLWHVAEGGAVHRGLAVKGGEGQPRRVSSLPGVVWRYYRAHGIRAVILRIRDELRARRQMA